MLRHAAIVSGKSYFRLPFRLIVLLSFTIISFSALNHPVIRDTTDRPVPLMRTTAALLTQREHVRFFFWLLTVQSFHFQFVRSNRPRHNIQIHHPLTITPTSTVPVS